MGDGWVGVLITGRGQLCVHRAFSPGYCPALHEAESVIAESRTGVGGRLEGLMGIVTRLREQKRTGTCRLFVGVRWAIVRDDG